MKIGLINNLYKPYQKGGAERVVEILANQLRELGHEVFIISTSPKTKSPHEEPGVYYLKSSYYELNSLPLTTRFFWQLNNLIDLKKYQALKIIFKKEMPDLIITNNLMGIGLLAPRAIKKAGARHFHILHDIQLLHPSGLMYFGKEKLINSLPAKIYQKITGCLFSFGQPNLTIISPSKWLIDLHQTHGLFKNNRLAVITNPLLTNDKPLPPKTNNKNFIFIGQLEKHKGVDLFIQAAARFLDYNFLVVGRGSLEIKTSGNLKVLGPKTPIEVTELLNDSLAVIVPSRCYENSPTVIYEAAAVGTPAIAANLGGIPELIARFGGLLFEPDNSDSLIMAIEEFIEKGASLKPQIETQNYAEKILALYK